MESQVKKSDLKIINFYIFLCIFFKVNECIFFYTVYTVHTYEIINQM